MIFILSNFYGYSEKEWLVKNYSLGVGQTRFKDVDPRYFQRWGVQIKTKVAFGSIKFDEYNRQIWDI